MDERWRNNKKNACAQATPPGFNALVGTLDESQFKALSTMFLILEESEWCHRLCCGPLRPFKRVRLIQPNLMLPLRPPPCALGLASKSGGDFVQVANLGLAGGRDP